MTWTGIQAARGGGVRAFLLDLFGFTARLKPPPSYACLKFVEAMNVEGGFLKDTHPMVDSHHDELWEAMDHDLVSSGSAWDVGYNLTHKGIKAAESVAPSLWKTPTF
jgi:hypothetical protein